MEHFDLPAALSARGTDADAASALRLSSPTVARWRNGEATPTPEWHVPLARYLGVDVATVATWCALNAVARRRVRR